ncbi:PLP-dependent aminotransferase family protein [Ferrimonas pelagia]|uniref:PLP-dependent aminotransferase family protein n=1 Tax=Ferrimonas pelagia TaxID=1177826 RepID=A0ABP9F4I9_9GAMM
MNAHLFVLPADQGQGLQSRLQQMLVGLIFNGHLLPGAELPGARAMAKQLTISRNTVVLVYERLQDEGLLIAKPRRGYFVNPALEQTPVATGLSHAPRVDDPSGGIDWRRRLRLFPSEQHNRNKPRAWRDCRYRFIYGQLSCDLFPAEQWRSCMRAASSGPMSREWFADLVDEDDPMLLAQLRQQLLPKRGIRCGDAEILMTLGTQHSLYLLSQLLAGPGVRVGMECPGYRDAVNQFALTGAEIVPVPVDGDGVQLGQDSASCDLLYVTPSHQSPTTAILSQARRQRLLSGPAGPLIIEDDYEADMGGQALPIPALKSADPDGRVIYIGSFSKTLSSGLRLGFMVARPELIREARALRRLMLRHPPANNQRALALFLAQGYHDSFVTRLARIYAERRELLLNAIARHLPDCDAVSSMGATAIWLKCPAGLQAEGLQGIALEHGVFIETGAPSFFVDPDEEAERYLRLGFGDIEAAQIEAGIELLAMLIRQQLRWASEWPY